MVFTQSFSVIELQVENFENFATCHSLNVMPEDLLSDPNSFKAFLIKHQDAYHTIAFICPNTPDSVTIAGTAQSVNTVESFTGYDFFGFLDDGVEETVEDEVEVGIWVR